MPFFTHFYGTQQVKPTLSAILLIVICLLGFTHSKLHANSNFSNSTFAANTQNEFLNVEQAYQLDIDFQINPNTAKVEPILIWHTQPGYYLYKHGFKQYTATQAGDKNLNESNIQAVLPTGKLTVDEYFGEVETYYNQVIIPLKITASNDAIYIRAQSQGCADAGLCYPPYDAYAKLNITTQSAEIITQSEYQAKVKPENSSPALNTSFSTPTSTTNTTLLISLLSAFLGGLILNLMPCVLPVLSIKLLQIQQAGKHARLHGLAYMSGVIISFIAIAIVLISLRQAGLSVGWGFQLQQPWVIALLIFLFFTLALALSGFFELGSRLMGIGQSKDQFGAQTPPKISSAFGTGVLAVLVASPCTAPFMGTALGFALTQSSPSALLIFSSLGFGMALPLTAITFIPSLEHLLPKPGMWMVRLKEFFAFPLYLTCVWLLWVLTNQTSTTSLALVLMSLIAITFCIWCFKAPNLSLRILGSIALACVLTLFTSNALKPQEKTINTKHLAYSQVALAELRDKDKAVFIDLTADWCITCLANEKSTLNKSQVQQAFKDANITYMVGDWTNYNPEITALLEKYGRSGIPLYLLFPPRAAAPATILPQILTQSIVLTAIENISK